MAEQSSLTSSPSRNQTRPMSSFFNSPRFFTGFLGKNNHIETEKLSPTSILDIKPLSPVSPHFTGTKHSWVKPNPIGVGLALVDSLIDDERVLNDPNQPKMVVFGSKLKVQIPPTQSSILSPSGSPNSPGDFGIKTRNSQIPGQFSPFGSKEPRPATFSRQLSAKEMELSEDYTCVISHGPNPKTTHIYDNCVVESCCGVVGLSELEKKHFSSEDSDSSPESFLSFCSNCKKNLEQGNDIFMYRLVKYVVLNFFEAKGGDRHPSCLSATVPNHQRGKSGIQRLLSGKDQGIVLTRSPHCGCHDSNFAL